MPRLTLGVFPRMTGFLLVNLLLNMGIHVFSIVGLINIVDFVAPSVRLLYIVTLGVTAVISIAAAVWLTNKMRRSMLKGDLSDDSSREREITAAWTGSLSYVSLSIIILILHARYTAVTNSFNPAFYPNQYTLLMVMVGGVYLASMYNIVVGFFVPILTEGVEWRIVETTVD